MSSPQSEYTGQSTIDQFVKIEQFARLDEKTSSSIKNLGEQLDKLIRVFDDHVKDNRELEHAFTDQQRQFDRMTASLEAINRQLTDIALGMSQSVQKTSIEIASIRTDVDSLKKDRDLHELTSKNAELTRARRDAAVKRWIGVFSATSAVIAVVVAHFWK